MSLKSIIKSWRINYQNATSFFFLARIDYKDSKIVWQFFKMGYDLVWKHFTCKKYFKKRKPKFWISKTQLLDGRCFLRSLSTLSIMNHYFVKYYQRVSKLSISIVKRLQYSYVFLRKLFWIFKTLPIIADLQRVSVGFWDLYQIFQ